MKFHTSVLSLLLTLGAGSLSGGCADGDERTVSLVVEQIFGTTFLDMAPGVEHTNDDAIVTTLDLRTQGNYTELRPELVCVGVDRPRSFLQVLELSPDSGAIGFDYTFELREVGETQWQLLGQMSADIAENSAVFFDAPQWTIDEAGLQKLNLIALSDKPQYEARFTGIAQSEVISSLEVEVHIELFFSNRASDCP